MERKKKGSARVSITWSNRHQRTLNKILSKALKEGHLEVRNAGEFRLSEDFFRQPQTKRFLAGIPRDILDEMIAAWIRKHK